MAELLNRIGSAELAEWAVELRLRNEDEKRAYEEARQESSY